MRRNRVIPESNNIIWTVTDPQDRKVVLKNSTFDFHIAGTDHDENDSNFRKKIAAQAKQTIVEPEFIVNEEQRNIYFSLVKVPYENNLLKIKPMKVVVDADRTPNEVVTWTVMRKMNDTIKSEAIIYERNSNELVPV